MSKALPVASLLALGACGATSTGCDPARAGFLESMNCSNGGFQGRQAFLEQNLRGADANALNQRQRAIVADRDAKRAQSDLASRRRAVARLDGRIAEMRARLSRAETRPGVDRAEIVHARMELDRVERNQARIERLDPDEGMLRQNERDFEKLRGELKNLF